MVGLTQAIITILILSDFPINESLSTMVSLDALKGICAPLLSIARMHSLSANKLLFISAPSSLLILLLL